MRGLLLILIACYFALPTMAQSTSPERFPFATPAFYDVQDVIHPDTLNVRSGPDSNSSSIGALAADATRIEVVALSESGEWGKIRWGHEAEGWVSMRHLQQRSPEMIEGHEIETGLTCVSSEPYWKYTFLADGTAHGGGFDLITDDYKLVWSGYASNRGMWGPVGFVMEGGTKHLSGMIRRQECENGASSSPFGFSLEMILTGSAGPLMVTGCCSLADVNGVD